MTPRYLKIKDAARYSSIGEKRLVQMVQKGILRGCQDVGNKNAWIVDRFSIDEYWDSQMPEQTIKQNVLAFLERRPE